VNPVGEPPEEPRPRNKPRRPGTTQRNLAVCAHHRVVKSGFGSVAGVFVGKPANVVSSNDDLGLGAGFGEESSRLQCALSSAADGDAATLERPDTAVVDRVGNERRRKLGELWRAPGEGNYAGGDDPLHVEDLAVLEFDAESVRAKGDTDNAPSLQTRERVLLEPAPVIDETLERHRLCAFEGGRSPVASKAERVIRVGDTRGLPSRAEQHPSRDVMRPTLHRLSEGTLTPARIRCAAAESP
jgi:hypothetical protein